MLKFSQICLLLLLVLVVGCSSAETLPQAPENTQVVPTEVPATEVPATEVPATATPEPTATLDPISAMSQEEKDDALVDALQDDDVAQLAQLITAGADVDFVHGAIDSTPLVVATLRNNIDLFTMLVEAGADLSYVDKRGNTLLHHAVANGESSEIVALILAQGETDLEQQRSKWDFTALHVAAMAGNTAFVEMLVEAGADLESHDEAGDTPLNIAAWQGQLGTIERLIELGAVPIVANERGRSGIDHSQNEGHDEVAAYLMTFQEPGIADGMTQEEMDRAMLMAAQRNKPEDVAAFLEAGADPNATVLASGAAGIHFAAVRNSLEMFNLLVDAGADITALTYEGESLLHFAGAHNGFNVAESAMTLADFDLEGRRKQYGFTPLVTAAFAGHVAMVELLIANGADIEAVDDYGDSSVNVAAYAGHVEAIRTLVDLGANPDSPNSQGATALTYAQDRGHPEAAAYLESVVEQ